MEINKKRVLRLMQRNDLLVKPDTKLKATRAPCRSKPRLERPNQWWGIDMTKAMVGGFANWGALHVIPDFYVIMKKVSPGFHAVFIVQQQTTIKRLSQPYSAKNAQHTLWNAAKGFLTQQV